MKLLYRIVAAPIVAVVCLLAAGHLAMQSVTQIVDKFATLRDEKLNAARTLGEVDSRMATINALLYRTISVIDSSDAKSIEAVRQRIGGEVESQIASLKALMAKLDPALAVQLDVVVVNLGKYKPSALQALTMAEMSPGAAVAILASAERSFTASAAAVHQLTKAVNAEVDVLSNEVLGISARARALIVALTLGAALVSLGLAAWLARRMVGELDRAVTISEAVAQGRLDVAVPAGGGDEMGRLLNSLRNTVKRLGDSLGQIQAASGSIDTASSEIAAGSQDLSIRTEQTASNLQETASSVVLLRGSMDQSASAAHEASVLVDSAANVAERGGRLVTAVVSTMQEISTSSRQISEIIGVIDGIAFQTNILALNAAVEAARAGEQGRGFAVVAAEVRALAGRSAAAAKQIKVLIGTSVERVESGSRLVGEAGTTMQEIVTAVSRVDNMIRSISSRVLEQTTGIGKVSLAIADWIR